MILNDVYPKLAQVFGSMHHETFMALAMRGEALSQLERYDEASQDSLIAYRAAVQKDGEHSLVAIGALYDMAENQCRAGRTELGINSSRRAYADAAATYGLHSTRTQMNGVVVAECLIAAKQYESAKPFLANLDVAGMSVEFSDPDLDAIVDLLKAEVAYADGNADLAGRLLVRPRQVFQKPGTDRYYGRAVGALDVALASNQKRP